MSEEISLEELSREVDDLRESVNTQRLCLGFLSIVVFLLLAQSFMNYPNGSSYLAIIVIITIPIVLVICRLEQHGL